jgi:hypothetical protein
MRVMKRFRSVKRLRKGEKVGKCEIDEKKGEKES